MRVRPPNGPHVESAEETVNDPFGAAVFCLTKGVKSQKDSKGLDAATKAAQKRADAGVSEHGNLLRAN